MNSFYVLLLPCLIGAVYGTICNQCWVLDEKECCHEKNKTCAGEQCMTYSVFHSIDNKIYTAIKKTCGDSAMCSLCFTITSGSDFSVLLTTQCGTGDHSNANLNYNLQCEVNSKPNGLCCPACYLNNTTDGCKPTRKVPCFGNEKECIDYRGKVELPNGDITLMSVQGCVTEGGCAFGFGICPAMKEIQAVKMECTAPEKITD